MTERVRKAAYGEIRTTKTGKQTRSPEYKTWVNIRYRCRNADRLPAFRCYSGISVCERWDDFSAFLADMGRRPGPQYSIDRIDNNGNYEPGNCRWATATEQNRNTSKSVVTGTSVDDLCAAHGIPATTFWNRRRRGWDTERALTTPRRPYKKHQGEEINA